MTVSSVSQHSAMSTTSGALDKEVTLNFSAFLSDAASVDRGAIKRGVADFVSGQIGLNLTPAGVPKTVIFFDKSGVKLTQSTFEPESILREADRLGIPLSDLAGLADKLDEAGVAYLPYAMFNGSGSDHGIDLRDLAAGGLGTAYDWTKDANASQKGAFAEAQLAASKAFAERKGLIANPAVTNGGGLKTTTLAPQIDGEGVVRNYAVTNGSWAAWYRTPEEAQAAANASHAALLDLTQSVGAPTAEPEQTDFTRSLRKFL